MRFCTISTRLACTSVIVSSLIVHVVQMVREAGGVTIADEVQSGFGRTGSNYWGFQNQGVQPDIVTMAKGIGNGLPLAAVVTTPEIARSLATRSHLNTFGGNPVCCAGGRAVLQAIDEDGCQENSAKVGSRLQLEDKRNPSTLAEPGLVLDGHTTGSCREIQ